MSRRRRLAAVGLMVLVAMAVGGWLPASGNDPEPPESFTTVDVDPSDDLPESSGVTVTGVGFYAEGLPNMISVRQCVAALGACGPETSIDAPNGDFVLAKFVVVRYLVLSDTTVDCTVEACEVWASGGPFANHHLTFSTEVPTTTIPRRVTTTTRPAGTSTVAPTTTTTPPGAPTTTTTPRGAPTSTTSTTPRPAPGATIPPTTRGTQPTTSTAPTTSSTAPSTTTTVPPPPADEGRPPLVAVTTKNQPSGPPGGGLQVEGTGYTCETVYFFFDGIRVGSASPDAAGHVSQGGLSVPGDAKKGRHQVTSSCDPSGDRVEQASLFEVQAVSVHRPALVTSLALPSQVNLELGQLLLSAAMALAAIALIAFPYKLFNSTMEENYDEIRHWFGLGPRGAKEPRTHSRTLTFFAMTAVTAVACGFLSPDFGLNMTSLVLFLGMCVAIIVMAVVFSLPAGMGIHRQFGEWGKLNFLPGSVVVAVVMVLASRVFDFQPGFFYGALAGLAFRSALSEKDQGRMTAANWMFSLVISVGAFFLRAPVAAAAAEPGSSVWWIGLDICLALIFLWGIEGLAVAMLPMKFLDGAKVMRWNRPAWAVLFFLGIFATVHVLLRPGSGYVGSTTGEVSIAVMALFVGFGLGSVAFWAYFRFRPVRLAPIGA
jgi:hypothetical protein